MARLDVGARALLDLWLRQGVEDVEIAAVLGARPGDVAERRAQVLHRLMFETGATPGGAREALVSELRSVLAKGGPALVYGPPSQGAAEDPRERASTAPAEAADHSGPGVSAEPSPDAAEAAATSSASGADTPDSDRPAETGAPDTTEPAPQAVPLEDEAASDAQSGAAPSEAAPSDPATEAESTAAVASGGRAAPATSADPNVQATTDHETPPASGPPRSRIAAERRLVVLAAAALLAIGALVAGALLRDRPVAPPPPGASPALPPADDPAWVELNQMPAAAPGVEGTAALTGDGSQQRLAVRASGLPEPPSRYRVWLSNPPGLTPVARLRSNSTLSVPLQADPSNFRFVFVLLDEKWGGPRGALAVPTQELLSARSPRGPGPAR